ncbi:MAG: hypothetical protein ACM3QU_07815 [Verrucomicrobiota bacterium]
MTTPGEAYVLLGLRLGRHVEGLVDSYYGPPELKELVDAEPPSDPSELVGQGDELLRALEDGWLRDQVLGLRTYAGKLAGEEISYADEVERCYGVRPTRPGTAVYAAAHERLDELLPGEGPLAERYQAWRREATVPADLVVALVQDAVAELRGATARLVDLPDGEGLVVEEVRDQPWWAFNYYLGGLRSRVVVNLDVPTTCRECIHLAAHEVYPGHHTERALKEHLLVRGRGEVEETIQLVPTPSVVVGEGIAESGPDLIMDEELRGRLVAAVRRRGLEYDADLAEAIAEARRALRRVSLDAALMIHEDGASVEDAEAYVRRWALVSPEDAAHSVRFAVDATWRAYVVTYSAGRELCEAWVGGDPGRFVRLLTEQIRVGDLLEAHPDGR